MAAPKSLIFQLHKHWDAIEYLSRHARDLVAFSSEQILQVLTRFQTNEGELAEDALRSLCNAEILQPIGRSDNLQLNPVVLEFVRSLTHEHELGLSAVLKARIAAIEEACKQIEQALTSQELDKLRNGARQLSELFRQISQQLEQDRHAIFEIAEKAKAQDTSYALAKRYQDVLQAYDQYVEPMNEMMDSGLGGVFYPHLDRAMAALSKAEDFLNIRGALYSHKQQMRMVSQQAKELSRVGRSVAQQCADIVLPLRDEIRRYSQLSTAITETLGWVRKQGLTRALRTSSLPIPIWQTSRARRIQLGLEVRELMAQAQNFVPQVQSFPEEVELDPLELEPCINEQELRQKLIEALPVENLLTWLVEHYPCLLDATYLRLYHELAQEAQKPKWQAKLAEQRTSTELEKIRVHYHPYHLAALASPTEE